MQLGAYKNVRQSPSAGLVILSAMRKPTPDFGFPQKMISVSSATLNGGFLPYATVRRVQDQSVAGDFPNSSICSQTSLVQGQGLRGVTRPVSALPPEGAHSRFRQLQGDLVRKRKECEELKKTNNWLTKELHVEKVLLQSESERTTRNLRLLNQEMRATIKELRLKISEAEGRAALSERLGREAATSLEEVDCARKLAESQEKEVREERNKLQSLNIRLQEEIGYLQDKLTDVQHRLTLTERNYLESESVLEQRTRENQLKLEEIKSLEFEREKETLRRKELLEDLSQLKEREAVLRRAAIAAEEASDEASRLQCETERYRRMAEHQREEKSRECELWHQKHDFLSDILRSQEEEKAKRKNKACQAKFQTYFLCRTECDQRLSIAKTDRIPKRFAEDEAADSAETDEWLHINPERLRCRTVSSGREGQAQVYFNDLPPVKHKEVSSPSTGRKVVNYFWLPADDASR